MRKNIAIFASGSGSNAENIIRYFRDNKHAVVALVISNKSDAGVLTRVSSFDIPTFVALKDDWTPDGQVISLLNKYNIDFIVLAGFLRRIPETLLNNYSNKIINIHPSLLPKYGGKGMYGDKVHQAVVAAEEKESGITIHYVNEHYDEGGIIYQATCPVLTSDTPDDVAAKVHQLEYKYYPVVIEELLSR